MTPTDDLTTVRLSGHDGLLVAIPAMLGFHPQESLVMVCVAGPRQRVGPVIRVDLCRSCERPGAGPVGSEDLRRYARHYADQLALVCYTAAAGRPHLLDQVESALRADGADILDVVLVRDGHAYPAGPDGAHGERLALPGPEHPQRQLMTAASALQGRAILPDRAALRRSVAGPTGTAAADAAAAMTAAADQVVTAVGANGPLNRRRLRRLRERTVDEALLQTETTGSVSPATAAVLALLATDVHTRDHLAALAVRQVDRAWMAMLIAVARATPDDDAAQICAVLALTAYSRGDGALAQVAVDRVLTAEPGHRLAHLMVQAMAAGLPPDAVLGLTADSLNPDTAG